jgi:diacylglycerol kinase (ATP)
MQATLIYNPNSGGTGKITPEELSEALSEAGYDPVYRSTGHEEELDQALRDIQGLVVVAGGDGTIRAVANRLIGKDIPIAIVPGGTANNIARALAVEGKPLEVIAGLKQPMRRYFDVGRVQAPWGEDYFLEAAGYGLYASTLAAYNPEEGKSVLRSIEALTQTLNDYEASYCRLLLDGKDISGTYILVEALNTPAFGPRIKAAPNADPSDGLFEVLCVRDETRPGFLSYLTSLLREELDELPSVEVNKGRKLEICWQGVPFHVDGEVRPLGEESEGDQGDRKQFGISGQGKKDASICVEILPGALEFWLPETDYEK